MVFTWKDALIIGIIQAIALLPGISRSGITIACALILGFTQSEAARYSFLLSIPAIVGGFVFELKDSLEIGLQSSLIVPLFLGWLSAALSGLLAIKLILLVLKENRLFLFSIYCWIVGFLLIFLKG